MSRGNERLTDEWEPMVRVANGGHPLACHPVCKFPAQTMQRKHENESVPAESETKQSRVLSTSILRSPDLTGFDDAPQLCAVGFVLRVICGVLHSNLSASLTSIRIAHEILWSLKWELSKIVIEMEMEKQRWKLRESIRESFRYKRSTEFR